MVSQDSHGEAADSRARRSRFDSWRVRGPLLVLGLLGCAVAVLPEIRATGSGGFGVLQTGVLIVGLFLAFVALAGRRTPAVWRGLGLVLLNTVLLLIALELVSGLILRVMNRGRASADFAELPFFRDAEGRAVIRDYGAIIEHDRYEPYVLWKRAASSARYVNVDSAGIRRTVGSSCEPGAPIVFAFGGSTMFGAYAPDDGTIPSYMTETFARALGRPVCVTNFGELAWNSTQELIFLQRQLQRGARPDYVIFYDGVNDTFGAYARTNPYVHHNVNIIAAHFEQTMPVLRRRLAQTRIMRLAGRIRGQPFVVPVPERFKPLDLTVDELAAGTMAVYLENHRMVGALAREYGFEYAFFWQPMISTTGKRLTPFEAAERGRLEPDVVALFNAMQDRIEAATAERPKLHDLTTVLDGDTTDIFYDWHHVVPAGNRIIADAIARRVFPDAAIANEQK
jgi:hypothetical protein